MVQAASLFSQLLRHFSRAHFAELVLRHDAERYAKGFSCWTQFVAMLFCQLGRAESLREICNGLRSCLGKLYHLGIAQAPNKSVLSYANRQRPAALYRDLFYDSYDHFRAHGGLGRRKARFRFKNKLLSLDATVITLCLKLFPWAEYRRAKGGVKVHTLLDHDTYLPVFVDITTARQHESRIARTLQLNPDSIVAMDRAFIDYTLFHQWTCRRIYFVTREKQNAVYEVVESRAVPHAHPVEIRADQVIRLAGPQARRQCPDLLRRVVLWDEEKQREVVLLTNHLDFGATTIAAIYKDRWEIEIFFKALKQNLKVKTFVGTTENALAIQIWTALIAMLLLKWLHFLSQAGWSLSNLVALLRWNLFTYRELMEWLHDPYRNEPLVPRLEQLAFTGHGFGQPGALTTG